MYKSFRIFSFLILSTLWINPALQAIGGLKVEEVSGDEIKRKGILKIQHADGSLDGTGVLFQEGKGWLGLSVRHCFTKFHPLNCPMIAWLGEEKRDIIKTYPSTAQIDLALFVLNAPFEGTEEFPILPDSLPDNLTYEGCIYGYGLTTASTHPGSLKDSKGICRKGKVFLSPFREIGRETHALMKQGSSYKGKGLDKDVLISFSTFHKKGTADDILSSLDKDYELNTVILDEGYLPIGTNETQDQLLSSPCFPLCGDSGGPVLSEANQIYALVSEGFTNDKAAYHFDFTGNLLQKKDYRESTQLIVGGTEITLGFTTYKKELHFGLKYKQSFSSKELAGLKSKIIKFFSEELSDYFIEESQFLHTLVKIEAEKQNSTPYLTRWLAKTHRYQADYWTSIYNHRDWIAKTILLAFQDIEQLQAAKDIEKQVLAAKDIEQQVQEPKNIPLDFSWFKPGADYWFKAPAPGSDYHLPNKP